METIGTSRQRVEDSFLRLIETYERAMRIYATLGQTDRAERERSAMEKTRVRLETRRSLMDDRYRARLS